MLRRLHPIAAGVWLATSRKDRTTTVVVEGGDGTALLVDPAWTPDELDGLAADLRTLRLTVAAGFSTHAHFDHLLWHTGFGRGRRWASDGTARLVLQERKLLLDELGPGYPRAALAGAPPIRAVERGRVPWPGPPAHLVVTAAHRVGHTSVWFPRLRLLVAGDLLSDVEVPLLAEDDRDGDAYRSGLHVLRPVAVAARLVVPGHGSPGTDALARLEADLRYLDGLRSGARPDDPRLDTVANAEEWDRQVADRS